jgi:two-component system, chemotaxis family, chemotaxis protein CheY
MSKTILIVDDSSSLRQVVSLALTRAGYDVIEGVDGMDALTKLDGRKINLIVSDVNMPRMDGITFVTHVKQNPRYKFTPVIMLTTEGQDAKKEQGRAAGAKAWIVKPFSPPVLLDAVSKLILP